MEIRDHWEQVYSTHDAASLSWFQPRAARSLDLIRRSGIARSAPIIDVGGGASTLVDDLLADGYSALTVLDLSAAALAVARTRLGAQAQSVHWLEADITRAALPARQYALWHDRAVFHFLTEAADRQAYVQAARHALAPGGYLVIATFAEDGPAQCSGLPVRRYDARSLKAAFADDFTLVLHESEAHLTPSGNVQSFVYCLLRSNAVS